MGAPRLWMTRPVTRPMLGFAFALAVLAAALPTEPLDAVVPEDFDAPQVPAVLHYLAHGSAVQREVKAVAGDVADADDVVKALGKGSGKEVKAVADAVAHGIVKKLKGVVAGVAGDIDDAVKTGEEAALKGVHSLQKDGNSSMHEAIGAVHTAEQAAGTVAHVAAEAAKLAEKKAGKVAGKLVGNHTLKEGVASVNKAMKSTTAEVRDAAAVGKSIASSAIKDAASAVEGIWGGSN